MAEKRSRSPRSPARGNTGVKGVRLSPPHAPEVLRPTRSRILDAAEHLFAEHGYDSVSMPMIAAASGITAGAFEPADSELLACAVMVFVTGLMHMETLLPRLVGDPKWRDFVEKRVDALLGTKRRTASG